jgi:predicted metal-dependent HD superfamily phosphohydrolase
MDHLIEEISGYVEKLFQTHSRDFLYHDLRHTKDVVNIVNDIAVNSGIDAEEKELLLIAAWFHDTGYPEDIPYHEERSSEIAEEYLNKINYPADKTAIIKNLILSTKMPQNPKTRLEEIICDADIAYIGKDDFISRIKLLRKEWAQTINKTYNDSNWLKKNINFIESNSFHTDYAKSKFGDMRKKNLSLLKQMTEKTES